MAYEWEELVKRYASAKHPVCNCGRAYYSLDGEAMISGTGKIIHNHPHCKHGCDANQMRAADRVAKKVLAELSTPPKAAKP